MSATRAAARPHAMSQAKISLQCPGCEGLVSFPGTEAGTVQECPECGGWVDVPELTRTPHNDDPLFAESQRQFEENARLLHESARFHEEWRRQLEQSARYQEVAEEAFGRLAALVARWEALTTALEKRLNGPG